MPATITVSIGNLPVIIPVEGELNGVTLGERIHGCFIGAQQMPGDMARLALLMPWPAFRAVRREIEAAGMRPGANDTTWARVNVRDVLALDGVLAALAVWDGIDRTEEQAVVKPGTYGGDVTVRLDLLGDYVVAYPKTRYDAVLRAFSVRGSNVHVGTTQVVLSSAYAEQLTEFVAKLEKGAARAKKVVAEDPVSGTFGDFTVITTERGFEMRFAKDRGLIERVKTVRGIKFDPAALCWYTGLTNRKSLLAFLEAEKGDAAVAVVGQFAGRFAPHFRLEADGRLVRIHLVSESANRHADDIAATAGYILRYQRAGSGWSRWLDVLAIADFGVLSDRMNAAAARAIEAQRALQARHEEERRQGEEAARQRRSGERQQRAESDRAAAGIVTVSRPSHARFDGAVGAVEWHDGQPYRIVERKAFRVDEDMPSTMGYAFLGHEGGWGVSLRLRPCDEADAAQCFALQVQEQVPGARRRVASALNGMFGQGGEVLNPPADLQQSARCIGISDYSDLTLVVDGSVVWARPYWVVSDGGDFGDYGLMVWHRFDVADDAELVERAARVAAAALPSPQDAAQAMEDAREVEALLVAMRRRHMEQSAGPSMAA